MTVAVTVLILLVLLLVAFSKVLEPLQHTLFIPPDVSSDWQL